MKSIVLTITETSDDEWEADLKAKEIGPNLKRDAQKDLEYLSEGKRKYKHLPSYDMAEYWIQEAEKMTRKYISASNLAADRNNELEKAKYILEQILVFIPFSWKIREEIMELLEVQG